VFLADPSEHLTGGDILNICVNAIDAGSTDANPDVGARDCEGEEGEGGALGGESRAEAEDWFSAELIKDDVAFDRAVPSSLFSLAE
jgi:hypothetical protein